jgi:hypothetical protein
MWSSEKVKIWQEALFIAKEMDLPFLNLERYGKIIRIWILIGNVMFERQLQMANW